MKLSFATVFSLVICTVAGGCAMHGESLKGRLVDGLTQQPIVGAVVYAQWYGSQGGVGHGHSNVCFHLSAAVTDAEGNYYMPFWTLKTDSIFDGIRTFDRRIKMGIYAERYPLYVFEKTKIEAGQPYELKKEELRSPEEKRNRFEKLWILGDPSCTVLDMDSERNYALLNAAVLPEAERLANTKDELETVEWMRARNNHLAEKLNNISR